MSDLHNILFYDFSLHITFHAARKLGKFNYLSFKNTVNKVQLECKP